MFMVLTPKTPAILKGVVIFTGTATLIQYEV